MEKHISSPLLNALLEMNTIELMGIIQLKDDPELPNVKEAWDSLLEYAGKEFISLEDRALAEATDFPENTAFSEKNNIVMDGVYYKLQEKYQNPLQRKLRLHIENCDICYQLYEAFATGRDVEFPEIFKELREKKYPFDVLNLFERKL